ncbi:MAG: iron-containing redox enzyme family protein [Actinomycetota bacterium]
MAIDLEALDLTTPSKRLWAKIGLADGRFGAAFTAYFKHPRIRDVHVDYLILNHQIIRGTVPLLERARDEAARRADSDAVARDLVPYFERHIVEELHHDDWLLDDLEIIGVSRADVWARLPSPTVAEFVGAQNYWALHVHPVAVLGYLSYMEGFPPTDEIIGDLIARTGYPREAFRTMVEHGDLDPEHSGEIKHMLDTLPLTEWHEALLGLAVISGLDLLARTIEEVVEQHPA